MNRVPLAERMRPSNLEDVLGQDDIIGEGKILTEIAKNGEPINLIFWGPPGTGKTTLARILAHEFKADFVEISAVTAKKSDIEEVVKRAKTNWNLKIRTVLFVDEIHRFNKAQQDAFLPHVESGLITLIGATTENPSFEVISPLLSRSRVVVIKPLSKLAILGILTRACEKEQVAIRPEESQSAAAQLISDDEPGVNEQQIAIQSEGSRSAAARLINDDEPGVNGQQIAIQSEGSRSAAARVVAPSAHGDGPDGRDPRMDGTSATITPDALDYLAELSGGDARSALGDLELALSLARHITRDTVIEAAGKKLPGYDKKGDHHYDTISAFIKSLRGSDVDAALYYLARMVEAGEDPKFIARRMVIFASEDIGLSGNGALSLATTCFQAVERIGMPESGLILAHTTVALALSKKSRATTDAWYKAQELARKTSNEPVPLWLRNAPTKLMRDLGYGEGQKWESGFHLNRSYLPESIKDQKIFHPKNNESS